MTTRPTTRATLRRKYLPTLGAIGDLLDKWRTPGAQLTSEEREAVFLYLLEKTTTIASRYYGRRQRTGPRKTRAREWWEISDQHWEPVVDRVLSLATLLRKYPNKSVGWCLVTYARTFSSAETLGELREIGVAPTIPQDIADWRLMRRVDNDYYRVHHRWPDIDQAVAHWASLMVSRGKPVVTTRRVDNFRKKYKNYSLLMGLKFAEPLPEEGDNDEDEQD